MLCRMLLRVRDDRLHADLAEMLRSHEANIALANNVVGCAPQAPASAYAMLRGRSSIGP